MDAIVSCATPKLIPHEKDKQYVRQESIYNYFRDLQIRFCLFLCSPMMNGVVYSKTVMASARNCLGFEKNPVLFILLIFGIYKKIEEIYYVLKSVVTLSLPLSQWIADLKHPAYITQRDMYLQKPFLCTFSCTFLANLTDLKLPTRLHI